MSDFQTEMQAWTNQLLQVLVLSCDWNALLEQAAWQPLCPNDDMQKKMLCASLRQRSRYVNQLTQAIAKLEHLMTSELSSTLAEYLWTFGEHLHKTMRSWAEHLATELHDRTRSALRSKRRIARTPSSYGRDALQRLGTAHLPRDRARRRLERLQAQQKLSMNASLNCGAFDISCRILPCGRQIS